MKTAQRKSHKGQKSEAPNEPLIVRDIARYLECLAWLFQDGKTGNAEFGDELRRLGDKLRPHGNLTVSELTITGGDAKLRSKRTSSARNGKATDKKREGANAPTPSLPENPRALSGEEVERLLEDDSLAKLTKEQIAELGHARFSIAKSELLRLSKNRARREILAALKIERTMQGVAEQARRAEMMRSA